MPEPRDPQRTERSGVPIWWFESPGEVMASLCFRVGRSDEELSTRGITHLVEHLTLFPLGRPAYEYNGYVDDGMAVFMAIGELDEVCEFLRTCAANLRSLPLDRMATECRVLRTEAARSPAGPAARLLGHRFGARGYGLSVYNELGLRWLGPEAVQAWADERFVRGNAVVWMTAEPPADLDLGLADGAWSEPRRPEPLDIALPAHVAEGSGGVVLSTWGERSGEASAGIRIAGERVQERLRREAGLTYDAYGDTETMGGFWRHGMIGADCLDRDAERVREELWRVVGEMAEQGPTGEELEHYIRALRRFFTEPDALRSHLAYLAHDELHRYPIDTSAEALAELDRLSADDIAAATAGLLDSGILLSPEDLRSPLPGFHPHDPPQPEPVRGRSFRSGVRREGRRTVADVVHVSGEGMTLEPVQGDALTIRWPDAVSCERRPDGALRVLAFNETWIETGPNNVEDGEELVGLIREHLSHLPLLPSMAATNEDRLRPLTDALGDRPTARSELPILYDALDEDEEVLELCQATRGGRPGLFALTEDRLLWSTSEGDAPEGLQRAWSGITSARLQKRLLGAARVTVGEDDGNELTFEAFQPPDAAERVVAAAEKRSGAARPAG